MKLNQDCIRDLLLCLEENLDYGRKLDVEKLKLKNYSSEELLYTTEKLQEANFINCSSGWNMERCHITFIDSITYQGHQFLDTIRDDDIWSKTTEKAKVVASVSLPVLQQLATSFCKSKLGLP